MRDAVQVVPCVKVDRCSRAVLSEELKDKRENTVILADLPVLRCASAAVEGSPPPAVIFMTKRRQIILVTFLADSRLSWGALE